MGELALVGDHSTVPLTRISCNTVFSKSQNPRKAGTLCRWLAVVELHDLTLSIGKFFGQESTVVKWNYQILSLRLVTVCQKVPILDFQLEFSTSKIIRIFLIFYSLKNINLGAHFLISSIFKSLYFLKWCPILDSLPLLQLSKFNNFLWPQLIFSQKSF